MFSKLLCALSLAVFALTASTAFAQDKQLTEKDVERIITRFVRDNGDLLNASIDAYLTKKQKDDAASRIMPHTPTMGPNDAAVTIIEFSDFDCPFCARIEPTISELMRRYKGRAQFAFKHLPLETIHPKAVHASQAAQAAHRQGKFWEFRKQLFDRQEFSGEQLWLDIAKELDLDMKKFNKDRKSEAVAAEVRQDIRDGEAVGVRGTPFFLINGIPVSGAQPLEVFVAVIEDQLKQAQ